MALAGRAQARRRQSRDEIDQARLATTQGNNQGRLVQYEVQLAQDGAEQTFPSWSELALARIAAIRDLTLGDILRDLDGSHKHLGENPGETCNHKE